MVLHPATEVEFEEREHPVADQERGQNHIPEQSITLELSTAEEGKSKDWDIYPMNSLEVIGKHCMHSAFNIT